MAAVFYISTALIAYHFVIHPALLLLLAGRRADRAPARADDDALLPSVSVLVPCCNEGPLIREKAENLLNQNYPAAKRSILFAADGPEHNVPATLADYGDTNGLQVVEFPESRGKIPVLNDAVAHCHGEILVLTDVSARFERDALRWLVAAFADPDVGGVCGALRVESTDSSAGLSDPQRLYWRLDDRVKRAESRLGSVTSGYGSIYAIRRGLFTQLPASVTDDSFQAMAIVRQGWRFVFEPRAQAWIKPRSKSFGHEISRRRRVVLRSLRGLWLSRELVNVHRHGVYAVSLLSQKVLRRILPVLLLAMLVSAAWLAPRGPVWFAVFASQAAFYLLALSRLAGLRLPSGGHARVAAKLQSLAAYFLAGQVGTFLGTLDFLRGRRVDRWAPAKG
jgi:cellulose synthase/poly-beta-1,6-N-acetylglucosamine synthase-like glycosyltransferase